MQQNVPERQESKSPRDRAIPAAWIGVVGAVAAAIVGGPLSLQATGEALSLSPTALNFRDLCLLMSGSLVPGDESATG